MCYCFGDVYVEVDEFVLFVFGGKGWVGVFYGDFEGVLV